MHYELDWNALARVSADEDYVLGSVLAVTVNGVERVVDAANNVGLCVYTEGGMVIVTNPTRSNHEAD